MEIYFNELSVLPSCTDHNSARNKILTMLKTMEALKEYDFNIIRTHNNLYAEDLGNGYSFSTFINDPEVNASTKLLLRSVVRSPFIVDEDGDEAEAFILNTFITTDVNDNNTVPEGLAVAYLYNSPILSLTGHPKWENETIRLIIGSAVAETHSEEIINLYSVQSLNNQAFKAWLDKLNVCLQLNSAENIRLEFPPDIFEFDKRAIEDIIDWYYDDKRFIERIKKLINDIRTNPFTGGMGLTEVLGGSNGKASKRIVKKDRIVYTFTEAKITIHQCREHYDE